MKYRNLLLVSNQQIDRRKKYSFLRRLLCVLFHDNLIYMKPKVIVILGPTASGKSDLAVALAKKYNGEVISADSRQVYKGLDIGTGKITEKEMRGIPHHLLDIVNPNRIFTVNTYTKKGRRIIKDILKRKKVPIICGGTGLYIDSLLGTISWPEVKPNIKLRKELEKKSAKELYEILTTLDSKRAASIDAKNPVRLIRAIEIATALGSVPEQTKVESPYNILFIGLKPIESKLKKKIHTRLLKRMKVGMMNEIRELQKHGLTWKRMESLGLEYRYGSRHLRGIIPIELMLAQLEKEIWNYSKRQMTWFKRNDLIHWFDPDKKPEKKIEAIVKQFLVENRK